jgi:hypothetical protein
LRAQADARRRRASSAAGGALRLTKRRLRFIDHLAVLLSSRAYRERPEDTMNR